MQVKCTSAVAGSIETRIHSEFSDSQTHIFSKTQKLDGQKLVKKAIGRLVVAGYIKQQSCSATAASGRELGFPAVCIDKASSPCL